MSLVESRVTIKRSIPEVWAVLSDLTAMAHYMPGVRRVDLLDGPSRGVGAGRHCVFTNGVELVEVVASWDEGQGYSLDTTRFVKVPMRTNHITFVLSSAGPQTVVTQSMEYQMKGGPLAPILNRMARSMMTKALRDALSGLKAHVEAHP